ncbi:MAG: Jag N-terminal domain-containing protein [Clostridiales bacterium]|nr:Jag N-terminal domain-containing protein [Clostridiales bacterium]
MLKSIETTGKTENDAIAAALKQLNLDRDSVSVQVIDRAKTGFLGIGSKPAKVKVTYEAPDEPAPAPVEEAPAPVVEEPAPAAPVEAVPVAEPKPEKKADAPRPAK